MAATVLMILVIALMPWVMIRLADKVSVLKTLGSVFLCYAAGILLSFPVKALGAQLALASDAASVIVCLAMPLILFSADLPALRRLARPMVISFALNAVSVMLVAVGVFFVFKNVMPDAAKISGMLVGTYTGGTPNMFAIGHGLGASSEQMLLLQTSDMIGGGIYFFLILSFLPGLMKKFLPDYNLPAPGLEVEAGHYADMTDEGPARERGAERYKRAVSCIKVIGLALVCVVIAMGICLLMPSRFGNTGLAKLGEHTAIIMLVVTTLGIALSFVKKVRTAPGSYKAGQYCILMFSVAMGLCFDVSMVTMKALTMFGMLLAIQFGTVVIHFLLAKFCRIDYHTTLITSTAGVFGPAFIIPVAQKLKNDAIILPGILCGILGYAVGNYLGLGIGELLQRFG